MSTNPLFNKRRTRFWTGLCTQTTRTLRLPHLLAALGLALALMMYAAPSAQAATITVDGTTCTLADAITAANTDTATGGCPAGSGADTIELLQDITLTSALPQIATTMIIEGNDFTIMRDPGAPEFRILFVGGSGDLTVNQATITGGRLVSNFGLGGGIFNGGTLQLTNSNVSNNQAFTRAGIANSGSATLDNVTVADNNSNNGIAGIANSGTMVITNSTIRDNVDAPSFGGGITNEAGTLTVINSTISGNTGPGILNRYDFFASGTSVLTLSDSTISDNSTVGVQNETNQQIVLLERNLISGNGNNEISNSGTLPNGSSYNVVGYGGSARSAGFTLSGSDIVPAEPLSSILDTTLQNNGGDTETHALVTGSPAVDAAPSGPAADQRGVARPQGCAFDIGAYELEQAPCVVNEPPVANAGPDQTVFRNDVVTVSGTWTDPNEAADNPYTWAWDLDGDAITDDSGSANYGDTIVRTTSFAVEGVATLTFTVTDSVGATSSDTVDITVVNRAPVADDQSVSTDEDTAVPVTLTASDADGDSLTYSIESSPSNGTLSGTAPNLTYTPNANYFGSDSFTFKANDGLADSNIATVSITVNSVNDPVVAVDDSATTDEDTAVNIDVQANDSAGPANEDPTLSTTAVTDPPHGTAVINPDGSVTYTPDPDYNGTDSFDYTVCDSEGACDTATVTVLVEMVNDPPTANDDSVTTDEDTPVTFDVLANDSDVDGNLDPSSVSTASSPSNGTLTDNGNGSFTYSPDANYFGNDEFTYQVCDSDNVCDSATVSITVNPVNDAPVCTDVAPSVSELWPPNHQFVPVTFSGATDIEGDAITISVSSIFQDEPTNGTGDGDTSPDGQGIGSSTAEVRSERQGNGNGRYYHITISASDGNGGTCSATVQVSVPKNQGKKGAAVDDGSLYDSTQP